MPGQTSLVSTGGIYVSAEKTGAEIYIDNQLVRETRVFRRAFYSQGLEATTHRIHVQKDGHHTWVKELPVYPHLVTEAQAFNLPLVPQVRLISPWNTTSGVAVLTATSTVLLTASTTNQYLFEPRASTSSLSRSSEYQSLLQSFLTPTSTTSVLPQGGTYAEKLVDNITLPTESVTTKEWRGVQIFERDGDVFASYVGPRSQMPYYYCAEPFPPYVPASSTEKELINSGILTEVANAEALPEDDLLMQVKNLDIDSDCEPLISIDRKEETVKHFDFFPNSTDLVLLAQESGIYVVEIDNRAWQNRQPLLLGTNLDFRIINGGIYVFDGKNIYQIVINQSWF